MSVDLRFGDCFDVMPTLRAGSVDMILADLPYGTTQCAWDSELSLEPLWKEYRRICRRFYAARDQQCASTAKDDCVERMLASQIA